MCYALVFSLLSIVPQAGHVNQASAVELNHFYDEKGRIVFDQLIVRDEEGHIREWTLIKDSRPMDKTPEEKDAWEEEARKEFGFKVQYNPPFKLPASVTYHKIGNKYRVFYMSGVTAGNYMVAVDVWSVYHTDTQYDPELLDRELLPKEWRVPLQPFQSR
jgi:hypothetical protein